MENLKTDVSNKANGATAEFRNKIKSSEHQLEKLAKNAGEVVDAMASDIVSTSTDIMKSSREFIKENPVKGVAIAGLAGLMMGSLLTMAMRSRRGS